MRKPVLALAALLVAALTAAVAGGAATGNLPGGTSISISIAAPAVAPASGFTVSGTAAVGSGVAVANTTLIYVLDVSGSTGSVTVPAGSCPQVNVYDNLADTTLDCELGAVRALNNAAILTGTVKDIGFIPFGGNGGDNPLSINDAAIADLGNATGQQSLVAPNLNDFTPPAGMLTRFSPSTNLDWMLMSAYTSTGFSPGTGWLPHGSSSGVTKFTAVDVGSQTNYQSALYKLHDLIGSVSTPKTLVVFLSDGEPNLGISGESFSTTLASKLPAPGGSVVVDTFAVGTGASCLTGGTFGSLKAISDRTGGTCTALDSPSDATSFVPAAIASQLSSIKLTVDGGPTMTPDTVAPSVPRNGPTGPVAYSKALALPPRDTPYHICATAAGSDGAGPGNLSDCTDVLVKAVPTITFDGGGDGPDHYAGHVNEGSSFPLDVTLGGTADLTWAYTGGTGSCTIGNGSAAHTSITCNDNGDRTITLTADDHVNPPVTLTEHLDVANVKPSAVLTLSPGPHPLAAPVGAHVAIADPGTNDTFMCGFDFGDGVTQAVAATGTTCDTSHLYPAGGPYTIHVTVSDDDGGVGFDAAPVAIDAPPVIDLGFGPGRDGTFAGAEGSWTNLPVHITDDGSNTILWSYAPGAGTDAGAGCNFSSPSSASTMILCNDDGDYNLTIHVEDGVNPPVEGHAVYHVSNVAPVITAVTPSTSGQTVNVTAAVIDAGANDTQRCSFAWGDASADTTGIPVAGGTCTASHTYASGVHSAAVTVTATDDDGDSATRGVSVTLNRPPSCSAVSPSLTELWPPDHTMRLIVLGGATDADHDPLAYAITSVRQDEPTNGLGDGDTAIDASAAGPGAVRLRAERSGNGDGRVYTIAFTVSDGHDGSCGGSVQVTVPKSASKPAQLSPGPGYDSFH